MQTQFGVQYCPGVSLRTATHHCPCAERQLCSHKYPERQRGTFLPFASRVQKQNHGLVDFSLNRITPSRPAGREGRAYPHHYPE